MDKQFVSQIYGTSSAKKATAPFSVATASKG
jgi:predicted peroxiredoxin